MANLTLFLTFVLACVASTTAIKLTECGPALGKLEYFEVPGCEGDGVCKLKLGQDVTGNAKFVSDEDVQNPYLFVDIILGPLTIPFIQKENACLKLIQCPVKKGQVYEVTETMKLEELPEAEVTVRCYGKDENDKMLFCYESKVKLVE